MKPHSEKEEKEEEEEKEVATAVYGNDVSVEHVDMNACDHSKQGLETQIASETHWPQLRRAPIKFGWFNKLYNINVNVLYKQADMGFASEAGLFLGGGKGAFCPQKGCNAPSAG